MLRALIIDDHTYWQELIAEILETDGYQTVTAANRKEAVALIKASIEEKNHFQIVTLDHNLVDSDSTNVGVVESQAVLDLLRHEYPAPLGVIVVSGRADTRDVRQYLRNTVGTEQESTNSVIDLDFVDKNGFRIAEFKQIAAQMIGKVTAQTQAAAKAQRDQLFVSYSHLDAKWLDRIKTMLKPVLRKNTEVKFWDDTQIAKGAQWYDEIATALRSAKVALLLVSANFLNSEFIHSVELPALLEGAKKDGVTMLWVAVSHSMYKETPLNNFQCVNDPSRPLDSLGRKSDVDKAVVEICEHIKRAMEDDH